MFRILHMLLVYKLPCCPDTRSKGETKKKTKPCEFPDSTFFIFLICPCFRLSVLLRCVVESAHLALPPPLIRHCVVDVMEQTQTDDGRGRVRRPDGLHDKCSPAVPALVTSNYTKGRVIQVDDDIDFLNSDLQH